MAGVFLSYDRDDSVAAKVVATALEKAGHSVWWDLHVRGGAQFSKVIEEALKAADCVVVLWSARAIESAWVRDEAATGRDTGRLIPTTIDGTEAPLGFRQFQTIDLHDWKRGAKSRGYKELEHAVIELGGKPVQVAAGITQALPLNPSRKSLLWLLAVSAAAALAAAVISLRPTTSSAIPAVSVTASDPASKPLAQDLLVKLGSLQSAKTGSMRLLDESTASSSKSDLVFAVSGASFSGRPSANLLLKSSPDSSVLWSKSFEQDVGTLADLEQQMAFTSARVLACALEARNTGSRSLRPDTLKLYLNACAQLSEIGAVDASSVMPALIQVSRDAPWFEGGWSKLITAETATVNPLGGVDASDRKLLQQLTQTARIIDPTMPQIALAEVALLGRGAYARKAEILDAAKRAHPDDAEVVATRSFFLLNTGRSRDAIEDAAHAVEVDPLSPLARNEYISALAYAGRIDAAREELNTAERLWPGTNSVRDIKFRFNLRYGDPKVAETLLEPADGRGLELYLRAKIDPTPENIAAVTSYLPADSIHDNRTLANLVQAMAEFQKADELYELLLQPAHSADLPNIVGVLFRPSFKKAQRDPRFIQVMKAAGMLDYWQKSDRWPDFCFDADMPYDCKKEAAKLKA